ncbi:MAG: ABC transporter ATP-binding protein [Eubacteriales bacterium]|nr:ABC transporter ATP-binding protein [Eubacteriales bacterium]
MFKKIKNQFGWFLQYYKKDYIIAFIFLTLDYGVTLLPPRLLGSTADLIVAGQITPEILLRNILAIVVLGFICYVVNFIWGYKMFLAEDHIDYLSRDRIFRRILRQGPHFFANFSSGTIMGRATNDVGALSDMAGFGFMALYDATLWPILLLGSMALISPKLTLFSVLPYPLLIIFSRVLGAKLYHYYDEAQEAFDRMNESVLEGVNGVRVVRAYHLEESEKARFAENADLLFEKNMRAVRISQLYGPGTTIIPALAFTIAMLVGIYEIRDGRLTTGQLLAFSFYLNMLSWPMISIGEFMITSSQGSASMRRIDELLGAPLDVEDRPEALPFPADHSIGVTELDFTYPNSKNGQAALKDISFDLLAGRTLGLAGPVGSGKTSLLRQFLHFYPLEEGQVYLGGEDLALLDRKSLKQHISYVPQQSFLFSKSIKDNIMLGASDEDLASGEAEHRFEQVISWAALEKDKDQFIDGWQTPAGEKGIALSGGQKQRICIARALMKDSDLLILDDCLSAVDALTEEQILTALKRERQGKTTLIAAHRLSAIKGADLILVLDQGRISERGNHDELMALKGWYYEQFMKQQLELNQDASDAEL